MPVQRTESIINQILRPDTTPVPLTQVNYRLKELMNWLFGRQVFDVDSVKQDSLELHKDYNVVFNVESETVRRVMYDLAQESGFFKYNSKVDPVQEGKRCLFMHILGRITKEPLIQQGKEQ